MPRRKQDATNKPHKKKLTREFLLKSDAQLGEKKETAYFLSSYRNIFYNVLEKNKDISVLGLSILLWAYPYTFFSMNAIRDRCRVGTANLRSIVRQLENEGYIEQYSKSFYMTQETNKYSDIMDMSYTIEEEVKIPPRWRVAVKGTRLVNKIINEIDSGLISSVEWEKREPMEAYSYMKIPKDWNR